MSTVPRELSDPTHCWADTLNRLTFAFQPIVHIHTSETYGFEALLRGWDRAGFSSIREVFDCAAEDGALLWLNRELRKKAEDRFRQAVFPRQLKRFQERNITVAIEDFGTGFAGLQLLYEANPDVIKIDRFFINGVHEDQTKKPFVTNLVRMAHTMGIFVIAEGVENPLEFYTCREVGCDFVQGYLVQKPTLNLPPVRGCSLLPGGQRSGRAHRNPSRARHEELGLLSLRDFAPHEYGVPS